MKSINVKKKKFSIQFRGVDMNNAGSIYFILWKHIHSEANGKLDFNANWVFLKKICTMMNFIPSFWFSSFLPISYHFHLLL